MKCRKSKLINKRCLKSAINLFELKIDDDIVKIQIVSSQYYLIDGRYKKYAVDLTTNSVCKSYPDIE